ncbi:MAG: glutathione S-transferase family protein, partial [Myxococcota bacterium]
RLEEALGGGPWFCGEQFTAADIAIAIPMSVVNFFGAGPGDDHKRLKDWIDRINARPSFMKDAEEITAAMA